MESITLQTNNTIVVQGSRLGQVQFAASAESDTGAARLVSARIYAQGEGSFTSISNPASLVFATAGPDSQAAIDRIKVNEEGDFVPVENSRYSLGLTSTRFGEVYSSSGIFNSLVIDGDSPKIFFKASGNLTPDITLNVLTTATSVASGVQTLSVQGSAGELFSITDILNTGTIFSVNDISGLELIGADADGTVRLAKFGTNVAVGNITPTQKLHVAGNFRLEGQFYDSLNSPGTSGEVLVSTSGGTDWRALSEIAGVDGTGSANYVARWSDADTIGTGVMFDDGFGVGIGTTTPGARLQVNTGGPMYAGIFVRGDASQSSPLQTWENSLGASLAQVDAGGRFSLRAAATGVAATHIPVFTADPASTTSQLVTRTAAQLRGDIGAQAALTNPVTGTGANGQVSFWTGTTTQGGDNGLFWSNTNKRLGLGLTDPSSDLHIRRTTGTFIRLGVSSANANGVGGDISWFTNESVTSDFLGALRLQFSGGTADVNRQMQFLVGDLSTPKFIVNGTGNVGIGTTSPAAKLHVVGDVISDYLRADTFNDGVGGAIALNASNTASDQYIAFGKNASGSSISFTEQMRLTTDGNFGIGVNSPSARLHVRSQTGDVSEVVGLIIEGTGTGARRWQLSPTASDTLLLAIPGLRLAAFDSNGKFFAGSLGGTSGASARFTASSSGITVGTNYWNVAAPVNGAIIEGNVGIGLNSTNVRLHVRDSSSGFSPDSVGGLFLENNGSSNNFYVFQVATVGGGRFFNLSNAGNVGIGTISPGARLHLELSSSTATGVLIRGATSQTADLQQWQNSSATALASVSAGGNLSLRAAATGVAATQIPVFTADPASTTRLLVTRTPAQLRGDLGAIDGTGVSGRVSFWSGTSTQSSDAALFWDNTNKRLGVGTASPQHLVDVSGTLRADHITAITKSFLIDHPTKPGKNLRYASLEGPENGVYFRGSNRGRFIYLPDYWSELVDKDTITVNLTPVGSYQQLWVENKNSNVIVVGGCNDHAMYDFVVWAERKDVDKLEVEC